MDDLTSKIIQYEQGGMDDDETILFFQELIDSRLAFSLQGSYGRTAAALIDAGHCHMGKKIDLSCSACKQNKQTRAHTCDVKKGAKNA